MTTVTQEPTIVQPGLDIFEEAIPYEETDDPNILTHIINPPKNIHIWQPGMTTQELVDIARAGGIEIEALCGHRFIPKHNPDKPDPCKACFEIAGFMLGDES